MDEKNYQACLVFTSSVGVKHFLVDLDGRHVLRTPSVGVAGICVCDLDFKSTTNLS